MFYNDDDIDRVAILADILKKFIVCNDGQSLSIYVDYCDLQNGVGELMLINYERVLKNSYCHFVFLSEKSCETTWTKFQKNCSLDYCINNPDLHKLVPIVTSKDVENGIAFGAFQPVDISKLLIRHRSLDEVEVDRLTVKDVNMKIINNIACVLKKGREKVSILRQNSILFIVFILYCGFQKHYHPISKRSLFRSTERGAGGPGDP